MSAAGRRWAADGIEFLQHDITETPFPVGPADFLYARLPVAHLAAPAEAVGQWLTQLAPGGRMALDEVEWIRTDEPVLEEYWKIATALIAEHGGDMYAGPRLAALPLAGAAAVRLSEVAVVPVPVARAARMFRLNLECGAPIAGSSSGTERTRSTVWTRSWERSALPYGRPVSPGGCVTCCSSGSQSPCGRPTIVSLSQLVATKPVRCAR